MDKKQGTLERARVAGVHTSEIMVSYFVVEGLVLILKLALSLTIICVAFGFEVKGSLPLLICIYMLMGIGGVSAGECTNNNNNYPTHSSANPFFAQDSFWLPFVRRRFKPFSWPWPHSFLISFSLVCR